MTNFSIQQDAAGSCRLTHHAAPRFTAFWTTGDHDAAALDGPCWSAPGSGSGEDSIHIHGVAWADTPPGQTTIDPLMEQAAQAIDDWIAHRL